MFCREGTSAFHWHGKATQDGRNRKVGGRMSHLISPKNSRGERLIKVSLVKMSGCWMGISQYLFVHGYNDVKST